MKKIMTCPLAAFIATFTLSAIVLAEEEPKEALSPNQIVEEAPVEEWVAIPTEDLLVMRLAPDAEGNPREVIIQLMPAPFSQGWVHNIKLLAREGWYDGISVNRVQDNYVVQWGDPNYDNPEATGEAKQLPEGLKVVPEKCYLDAIDDDCDLDLLWPAKEAMSDAEKALTDDQWPTVDIISTQTEHAPNGWRERDSYASWMEFYRGWPLSGEEDDTGEWRLAPVHCYGMVGVGRGYSPDTGSGAELYTVIGHAPRHLDRNIALVGRIIEGMEHLSSLPRGHGMLGFYAENEADKRTPILSIDVASDIAGQEFAFEYLSTTRSAFARYADARANRRDPFFIYPAGGADICNIPVPVRRVSGE